VRKLAEVTESPRHVLMYYTHDFFVTGKKLYLQSNKEYPFQAMDDQFGLSTFHILVKNNFPYIHLVNDAILHFWENGFLKNSIWITELNGYLMAQ